MTRMTFIVAVALCLIGAVVSAKTLATEHSDIGSVAAFSKGFSK